MRILGLHFGHDASAALIEDGTVVACVQKERRVRVKHALGLRADDVRQLLVDCAISPRDIDYCTVTSTQNLEAVLWDEDELWVGYERLPECDVACPLYEEDPAAQEIWPFSHQFALRSAFVETSGQEYSSFLTGEEQREMRGVAACGTGEEYFWHPLWDVSRSLERIATTDYRALLRDRRSSLGFHWPVTVELFGHPLPSFLFSHHFAHAAYAFFESGAEQAGILTHDGAHPVGIESGLFCYGEAGVLRVLTPHYLAVGELYDFTASRLGLGLMSGAGKLMGLASYGSPRFYNDQFAGNWYDDGTRPGMWRTSSHWISHIEGNARLLGHDLMHLGDPARMLDPINVDAAASTQKLFEESLLRAARALVSALQQSDLKTSTLCLSGGTALNCPTNTRLCKETVFSDVRVPPACNDTGLSLGSALALYHTVLGYPRVFASGKADMPLGREKIVLQEKTSDSCRVYYGLRSSADGIDDAIKALGLQIVSTKVADPACAAAYALARGEIVGWFEGRSEIGPRALGHRSILIDPRDPDNCRRVNLVKRREFWRPFAPMVLEDEAALWFRDLPDTSPYMLFTAGVRDTRIPSVTHVDGSACVQTVSPANGGIYRLLSEFHRITSVPVLLNTSFNGPGEPIVETPADALEFLLAFPLDLLFLDGRMCQTASRAQRRAAELPPLESLSF